MPYASSSGRFTRPTRLPAGGARSHGWRQRVQDGVVLGQAHSMSASSRASWCVAGLGFTLLCSTAGEIPRRGRGIRCCRDMPMAQRCSTMFGTMDFRQAAFRTRLLLRCSW